jgi:hypothetical protein
MSPRPVLTNRVNLEKPDFFKERNEILSGNGRLTEKRRHRCVRPETRSGYRVVIPSSSAVEWTVVSRLVGGSKPSWGASPPSGAQAKPTRPPDPKLRRACVYDTARSWLLGLAVRASCRARPDGGMATREQGTARDPGSIPGRASTLVSWPDRLGLLAQKCRALKWSISVHRSAMDRSNGLGRLPT